MRVDELKQDNMKLYQINLKMQLEIATLRKINQAQELELKFVKDQLANRIEKLAKAKRQNFELKSMGTQEVVKYKLDKK